MLALIAAFDENRAIGFQGKIPWHIPGEQRRFRELTTGQTVIMGRRTYAEIGHPLPHRTNIVLSRNSAFAAPGCLTATSLKSALMLVKTEHVYIAGGSSLYAQALPIAQRLYLTQIHGKFPGDTFFPLFPESAYRKEMVAYVPGKVGYTYWTYTRIEAGF